jgi:hypothetical protein
MRAEARFGGGLFRGAWKAPLPRLEVGGLPPLARLKGAPPCGFAFVRTHSIFGCRLLGPVHDRAQDQPDGEGDPLRGGEMAGEIGK